MYRRSLIVMRFALAFGLVALLATLTLPTSVFGQGGRQVRLNQVESRTWPDIVVNMTITGPDGKAVPDLNAGQFEVREQDQPQSIVGLALGPATDVPLSLVLATDVSGSMNADRKLEEAKAAAITFLAALRPVDTASLVAFNERVQVVVPATNNVGAIENGINALQAGGNTAIYDALYRSAQILNTEPATRRRAIILLTDGQDTSSTYDPKVASDVAKQTGALVYTIGLGPDANDAALTAVAAPTGGKYYKAPSATDLNGIYAAISVDLNSQVFLRYKSTTRLQRRYELVTLTVKYTAPDGQVIEKAITYRPPAASVIAPTPGPASQFSPDEVLVVGLPPGITRQAQSGTLPSGDPVNLRMMSLAASVLAGLAALMALFGISYFFLPSPTAARVAQYVGGPAAEQQAEETPGFYSRVVGPGIERIGQRLARISPKGYTDHIENLLTLTGPPYKMHLSSFLGSQVAISIVSVFLLLFWSLNTSPDTPSQWVLAAVLGLVIGLYFPYFWLKRKVTNRQKALLRALPGALDFLAINVEAGLGFDAALTQVVQRWRNTLTDEFALLLIDFQIGKPRKDAWRDLIQRTQVPELTGFITAMLQNEQVGSSIGTLLRTQADQMRIRRRQHAEEAARVAPVKMLLPMVFFIFPGVFVVILGPAIPQFLNTFLFAAK